MCEYMYVDSLKLSYPPPPPGRPLVHSLTRTRPPSQLLERVIVSAEWGMVVHDVNSSSAAELRCAVVVVLATTILYYYLLLYFADS